MNDMELDKILTQGKREAGRFFKPAAARLNADNIARERHMPQFPRARLKAAFAAVCVLAAAGACACLVFGTGAGSKALYTDGSLSEQTVSIGENKEYRLNTVPVSMPGGRDSGLMTVLWEARKSGGERLAYYSLFEQSDVAYPAMTIAFPGSEYDMLLISSGDSGEGSLGYRVVGFDGETLHDWWAQDGVPEGKVTLEGGVAVERCKANYASAVRVTYIVPVQIKGIGAIVLPIDSLSVSIGERILLIGFGPENVSVSEQSGLLSKEQQEQNGTPGVLLKALGAGSETLRIGPQGSAQTLSVDIEE